MAVTETKASLRLTGKTAAATAAAVTRALGMAPTYSRETGDLHPSPSLAKSGALTERSLWEFAEATTAASQNDFHGMDSLVRLTRRFEPHAKTLATLQDDYRITVDLMGFSDSTQCGLVIDADTMRRLGLLSADLVQSIYVVEDDAADEASTAE
jgi:hypothetical protein